VFQVRQPARHVTVVLSVSRRTCCCRCSDNYFSQLKRSLDGTHHDVSKERLDRYLGEFDFRYCAFRRARTAVPAEGGHLIRLSPDSCT
jgi:hypothetical protein